MLCTLSGQDACKMVFMLGALGITYEHLKWEGVASVSMSFLVCDNAGQPIPGVFLAMVALRLHARLAGVCGWACATTTGWHLAIIDLIIFKDVVRFTYWGLRWAVRMLRRWMYPIQEHSLLPSSVVSVSVGLGVVKTMVVTGVETKNGAIVPILTPLEDVAGPESAFCGSVRRGYRLPAGAMILGVVPKNGETATIAGYAFYGQYTVDGFSHFAFMPAHVHAAIVHAMNPQSATLYIATRIGLTGPMWMRHDDHPMFDWDEVLVTPGLEFTHACSGHAVAFVKMRLGSPCAYALKKGRPLRSLAQHTKKVTCFYETPTGELAGSEGEVFLAPGCAIFAHRATTIKGSSGSCA